MFFNTHSLSVHCHTRGKPRLRVRKACISQHRFENNQPYIPFRQQENEAAERRRNLRMKPPSHNISQAAASVVHKNETERT
jgi:hypothetical protein